MPAVFSSLMLALAQLADGRVLRILLKSLAVTVVLFILIGGAGWYGMDRALAWLGLSDGLFTGAGSLRGLAALLLSLLWLWLSWRIVAMAVIQFYADEVVQAVEARAYPDRAEAARDLPLREQLSESLKSAGRALLVNLLALPFALALLFTGIGPAVLFFLVNAALLGRELQDMVWLRHRRDAADLAPASGLERFLLGGAITFLLSIPVANFLAPLLGAAGATHLIHRKKRS
ncbi:uncharacterized protein involved in cysteine biosynthesis [Altererythrobacter atlanticus]|uniref:CysZ-like protein n=1 Tax=Croceibacterium atlanticum TaxID=1267766 RepID=A0A0F7KVP3_9SPHN|nr:EI24 domain-containing protein [Croceibacterium atlanticum]AKH43282.1 CysZ-like protein [Croceibacterium atlanticum]MBB5732012.1 uncharacterized protein involved in cysteine biosynthesis [Croceibacterium atlanticum]